jgi:hypothetical protein
VADVCEIYQSWERSLSGFRSNLNESVFFMLFNFVASEPLGWLLVIAVYKKASEVSVDEQKGATQ